MATVNFFYKGMPSSDPEFKSFDEFVKQKIADCRDRVLAFPNSPKMIAEGEAQIKQLKSYNVLAVVDWGNDHFLAFGVDAKEAVDQLRKNILLEMKELAEKMLDLVGAKIELDKVTL